MHVLTTRKILCLTIVQDYLNFAENKREEIDREN